MHDVAFEILSLTATLQSRFVLSRRSKMWNDGGYLRFTFLDLPTFLRLFLSKVIPEALEQKKKNAERKEGRDSSSSKLKTRALQF